MYQQRDPSLQLPALGVRGLSLGPAQWLKCMVEVTAIEPQTSTKSLFAATGGCGRL